MYNPGVVLNYNPNKKLPKSPSPFDENYKNTTIIMLSKVIATI